MVLLVLGRVGVCVLFVRVGGEWLGGGWMLVGRVVLELTIGGTGLVVVGVEVLLGLLTLEGAGSLQGVMVTVVRAGKGFFLVLLSVYRILCDMPVVLLCAGEPRGKKSRLSRSKLGGDTV